MKKIDINCDMGEGMQNEADFMPFISSCNIACGGHAGNEKTMKSVIVLAKERGKKIGAHPSYPDKENFGRISMEISYHDLENSILQQLASFAEIVKETGVIWHHIKPHGALYNDLSTNETLAKDFLKIIAPYKHLKLYVAANSTIAKMAKDKGFEVFEEAFMDRRYDNDLHLVSRKETNAVYTDFADVEQQILNIIQQEKVETISGEQKPIKAQTFCLHSDTPNALEFALGVYESLLLKGYTIG
ncbi:5-oxoprolinase subunit PxpA [Zhouia sp. PK063]|uniref:5-oxoprolinase subunit PxpA n=1 Tax=Zhouia sp. PK063 TaxID=3373602 RepID=UPI0037ACCEEA